MHEPATAPAPIRSSDEGRPAFAATAEEVAQRYGSSAENGLAPPRVEAALRRHGPNRLAEAPAEPVWKRLLGQFKELVIWILIVAAAISGLLGEWVDALAILAIVVLNAAIGFFQEERAGRALSALQKMSAPLARVIRGGELSTIPAENLVPGDRIELEAGDYIPADARLLRAFAFQVQEAALTGESHAIEKDADCVLAAGTPLGDRRNAVFMGTVAASGKASAIVVATGMGTELGRIAGLLARHRPEPTPLQRRLAELGRLLIAVSLAIVGVIFALQLARGGGLAEVFLVSVSLAVAAVPEGLPVVVTVTLALGLQRMVKRNALVRKLPSVETLGSVTVICSDKTGTLTRNEMTVREVIVADHRCRVTGIGYAPYGRLESDEPGNALEPNGATPNQVVVQALTIGARCNNARVVPGGDGSEDWRVVGDPTEGALIVAALKAGVEGANDRQNVLYEIPFDSSRKLMSVIAADAGGKRVMYTKGAPEMVLAKCSMERHDAGTRPLTEARRNAIQRASAEMASRALRVLGLAYRELPAVEVRYDEDDLVFCGLVGMLDPPRDEARIAVDECRRAGIRPAMITGDHPSTALAVARELKLAGPGDRALSGDEIDRLTDEELTETVERISVYARVTAEHKLRVVQAWKRRGEIVAMTGDGVNDAPAVKAADIGIAMGITGTEVTKEASDMVLTDDNFASIVSAVEEGRGIVDNIQKVLQFLLSCNLGEILLMLVASLLGWPAPLLAIQLLWINLVTDGLPALALALEPPEPGIMRRPPRPVGEPILSWRVGAWIAVQGVLVGAVALAAFGLSYQSHPHDLDRARAMAFCTLVYAELLRALAARSQTLTLWQLGLWSNPYVLLAVAVSGLLQVSIAVLPFTESVFSVPAHSSHEWAAIVMLALTPVTVLELLKCGRQWFNRAAVPRPEK